MPFLKRAGQSGLYHHFLLTSHCGSGSSSPLIHILSPSQSTFLSPSVNVSLPFLMFLLSLFPPPLKCRNPSTAFYQAFRPSRLRGSKPVNDRYELGCVYMYLCGLAWLTKPDPAPLQPCAPCKKMSILTCHLAVYGVLKCHFFWKTY